VCVFGCGEGGRRGGRCLCCVCVCVCVFVCVCGYVWVIFSLGDNAEFTCACVYVSALVYMMERDLERSERENGREGRT